MTGSAPDELIPGEPMPAEPVTAEPSWLAEVRLRTGRRVLWLRSLWADSRYPGEDAMGISHSEVDRAVAPTGGLARAERRFYREDATAATLSAAISQLLASGHDARWEHLTPPGLRVPQRRRRSRRRIARARAAAVGVGP
jgi:hypothetical protein